MHPIVLYTLDQNDGIFSEFVVLCCSLLSLTSYSAKLMKEPIFCKKLVTYSLNTYHSNASPWWWFSLCFGCYPPRGQNCVRFFWLEMSKPLYISSYWMRKWSQLVKNTWVDFFFVCLQQFSRWQSIKIPGNTGKSRRHWSFVLASMFTITEPYKTLLGHVGPGCELEGGPTD